MLKDKKIICDTCKEEINGQWEGRVVDGKKEYYYCSDECFFKRRHGR